MFNATDGQALYRVTAYVLLTSPAQTGLYESRPNRLARCWNEEVGAGNLSTRLPGPCDRSSGNTNEAGIVPGPANVPRVTCVRLNCGQALLGVCVDVSDVRSEV
jgi:hypothetical protein